MLRVEVSEAGQAPLPAIDVDGDFAIGSGAAARIRLPAPAVRDRHVEISGSEWRGLGEVRVDGIVATGGPINDGVALELAGYRVRIAPAPAGAIASAQQRTESLARELVRSLLGGATPVLAIERGPHAGAERVLAPPESALVIGRGDEAGWIIADADLSKRHAEIRRGWDGIRVIDLDSKNGTRLDGARVREAMLHDGALIELGALAIRFRDPAERYLGGVPSRVLAPARPRKSPIVFYAAVAIAVLALAGMVWVLTS